MYECDNKITNADETLVSARRSSLPHAIAILSASHQTRTHNLVMMCRFHRRGTQKKQQQPTREKCASCVVWSIFLEKKVCIVCAHSLGVRAHRARKTPLGNCSWEPIGLSNWFPTFKFASMPRHTRAGDGPGPLTVIEEALAKEKVDNQSGEHANTSKQELQTSEVEKLAKMSEQGGIAGSKGNAHTARMQEEVVSSSHMVKRCGKVEIDNTPLVVGGYRFDIPPGGCYTRIDAIVALLQHSETLQKQGVKTFEGSRCHTHSGHTCDDCSSPNTTEGTLEDTTACHECTQSRGTR